MSLTKEMMLQVEQEIENYADNDLMNYYYSYDSLNKHYPNSYYQFKVDKSFQEINNRGLDIKGYIENIRHDK